MRLIHLLGGHLPGGANDMAPAQRDYHQVVASPARGPEDDLFPI
jgi:hypothetical protein